MKNSTPISGHPTLDGSVCVNTDGGFDCECQQTGFEADTNAGACVDIDECAVAANCDGGTCTNIDGSYECDCPEGKKVGGDLETGLYCELDCAEGYELNDAKDACDNIDECDAGASVVADCGEGDCQDRDGFFKCYCPPGQDETGDYPDTTCHNPCGQGYELPTQVTTTEEVTTTVSPCTTISDDTEVAIAENADPIYTIPLWPGKRDFFL